jgi:MFS family permease
LTLSEYPKSVAQLIGLTLLNTLCYYKFFSALTPFAVKGNGLDDSMVFWALSIATALFVVLQSPFGWTADQFGRKPDLLDRAADSAGLDADPPRGKLRFGAAGVLLRAWSLCDEELDRPGDHQRANPDPATRA